MSESRAQLRAAVAPFESPSLVLAAWQIVTSIGLYLVTLAAMYASLGVSYWLTLTLSLPAAALLVRVFIVQHDCGHGSFFASRRANDIVGRICGVLTLAPYQSWRRQHSCHHANWNNLDRRESGSDIYSACLTVAEYRALPRWRRILYRLPRHPLIAHVVLPPLVFLLLYRVPFDTPRSWTAERCSVWLTNLAVAAVIVAAGLMLGFRAVLLVQLPVVIVTTIVGVWLFSVQHRFDDAKWLRREAWSFQAASLDGSSYLKLPKLLQWATGNIGFHHIHHLAPRIPNYRLAACHRSAPILAPKTPLTLARAFHASRLTLWDEAAKKLVRFRDARAG